jgi:hypothetical protein
MREPVAERCPDSVQPGPAIFVVKRRSALHFGSGFVGMKIVAVDEFDLTDFGETQADCRLAAARNAHDNKGEPIRKIIWRNRH